MVMPKTKGNFHYLLVMVDTFTGRVKALLCQTERASEGMKSLLKEIIPRFGLSSSIQSDNR